MRTTRSCPPTAPVPRPDLTSSPRTSCPRVRKYSSAARSAGGRVWVVTDRGAFRSSGDGYEPLEVGPRQLEPGQPQVKAGARVVAVAADGVGQVWVATDRGLYITDGEQWWQSLDRDDGVPYEAMTCLHLAPNGDVWGGTNEGPGGCATASFVTSGAARWLPGNRVRAIWTDAKNRAWLETDRGFACIEEKPTTLAQKAAHFDQITQERHNRRGFICAIDLELPGRPFQGIPLST